MQNEDYLLENIAEHKFHMGPFSGYIVQQAIVSLYINYVTVIVDRRTNKILKQTAHRISHVTSISQDAIERFKHNMQELIEKDVTKLYEDEEAERILLGESFNSGE